MEREHQPDLRPASRRADIAIGLIAGLGIVSICAALATKIDYRAASAALGVESSASLVAGEHHERLQVAFEIPGETDLTYAAVGEMEIDDAMEVIGVEVGGEACCFVRSNMLPPDLSVLNAVVGGRAVSLTYGDVEDRVRVFAADQSSPLSLGVGGIDIQDRLVLLLDGQRYTQCSSAVPLQDLSYVRTTWGEWRASHAATKVCVPGGEVYGAESSGEYEGDWGGDYAIEDGVEGESDAEIL